jgi:hypothetical protein
MARDRLAGEVRVVDPGLLALDRQEAFELAEAHGIDAASVDEIYEDAGSWIAGFVLHARARASIVDRDALEAYIATEIVPALSQPLRIALASTAGLEWVSEQLLIELAEDPLVASEILRVPLPGGSRRDGLQLAPCARRVLATTIDGPSARAACARAAWRLRSSGASADATDALIAAGHLVAAEAPAAEAAARGARDDRVLEWLGALDPDATRRRPPLREAQLRALHREGEHASVARATRAMRASGELESLLERGEPAAAWAVDALVRGGHAADVASLLAENEQPMWAPIAWAVTVLCRQAPMPPPADVGAVAMLPLASAVLEALVWRGQRADATALVDLAAPHDPEAWLAWCRLMLNLGDVQAARDRSTAGSKTPPPPERLAVFECELVLAEGDPDHALALLPAARAGAERAGDRTAERIDLAIVEGHALWLRGEPRRAIARLEPAREWALRRGLRAHVEWIDVWLAGAMVASGSAAAAKLLLEASLAGMDRAQRQLGRPLGSLVLAEACWQLGDEPGHDNAVDDALRRATSGTGRLMLRAGDRLMPGPLARRDRDSAWPGLHRRLLHRAIAAAARRQGAEPPVAQVRTLGPADIAASPGPPSVDGPRHVVELLAYLVMRGGAAPVQDALDTLVPTSAGTGALRRSVRHANSLLPEAVSVRLEANVVQVDPPGAVVSDDSELIRLAGAAALARGREAAQLRSDVRRLASAGPFLPGLDAKWARARREEVLRAAADCSTAGTAWHLEASTEDVPESAQRDLSRRLSARSALARGVQPETPAGAHSEGRSEDARRRPVG